MSDDEVPRELHRSVAHTIIDMVDDSDEPKIFSTAAGKAPASSVKWMADEDWQEAEDDVMEDDDAPDEEIIEHDRKHKREFAQALRCDEEYQPDLHGYFSQFPHVEDFTVIAMCRTYANYLAQKLRARSGPGPEKKSKTKN